MSKKANLVGGRELEQIRQENPLLGNLLRRIISAVTQTATSAGVSPLGQSAPPPNIGAVNVKTAGELVHVTINDTSPITTPIEYFIEHDTNPNFIQPHVVHLVSSRGAFLNLPSKNDTGSAQKWYFRAYSQFPGSQPSAPVYFGGLSPTGVTLTGTTQLTPLPSTGSGTASPTGSQGGWGRGKIPIRPAQGPKRQVA